MRGREPILHNVRDLQKYHVIASDAPVGSVHDLWFKEQDWTIRYIICQPSTAQNKPSSDGLILSIDLITPPDPSRRCLPIAIRQQQTAHLSRVDLRHATTFAIIAENLRVRSARRLIGYRVQSERGEQVGEIEDFVVEDTDWRIRYLLVDTHNWLPFKRILVAPHWLKSISWEKKRLRAEIPILVEATGLLP
ncbi:MAG: PRC-barrel domain-containing protein [Anaerolineales bacterium]